MGAQKSSHDVEQRWRDAHRAFRQRRWHESVAILGELKEALRGDHQDAYTESYWLRVNNRLSVLYKKLQDEDARTAIKWEVFERLGGTTDLSLILDELGVEEDQREVSSNFFKKGTYYYTCMHEVVGRTRSYSIVEKCVEPLSRETKVYEAIASRDLFRRTAFCRVPGLLGAIHRENYTKLFIDYIEGTDATHAPISFYDMGIALGETFGECSGVFSDEAFAPPALGLFRKNRAHKIFSTGKDPEAGDLIEAIAEFYAKRDRIEEVAAAMPSGFCHNELAEVNVIFGLEDGARKCFLVDWEKAGYDLAGSDIGDVYMWDSFVRAEEQGCGDELERDLTRGYLDALQSYGWEVPMSERTIEFASNLKFIRKYSQVAVSRVSIELLRRVANRCRYLVAQYDL